jgi:hypothetical protein
MRSPLWQSHNNNGDKQQTTPTLLITTTEGTPLTDDTAVADSTSTVTSSCRKPSHRTKAMLSILGVVVVAAVVLVSVLIHSRRSKQRQSCRDLQPGQEWALDEFIESYDNDPFDFSLMQYSVGYFYSYKHQNTSETKGPKILVMLDTRYPYHITDPFSWGVFNTRNEDFFVFQLTIGKDSSGSCDIWAGLGNCKDGNVTIDPNVVQVRLNSSNITCKVYNDTVFLVSYWLNQSLQVERRIIDLSVVTSSRCGMKRLLQEHTELASFYANWQAIWLEKYCV